MILVMLIVTWRLFAELRNHELFFDQTLATVATGEVPLDKAQYDMTRLHLAFDRDMAFQQSVYLRMIIYNLLIFAVGFLLLRIFENKNTRVLE